VQSWEGEPPGEPNPFPTCRFHDLPKTWLGRSLALPLVFGFNGLSFWVFASPIFSALRPFLPSPFPQLAENTLVCYH
jgi:hypothetical protein